MIKSAVITGVTGQDGSYLAELLICEGYKVFGGIRRNSDFTTKRIDHLFDHSDFCPFNYDAHDHSSLIDICIAHKPKLFFNLAALSHVGTSFDLPDYVSQTDGLSVVSMVNLIAKLLPDCVFYQASTSELFGGDVNQAPQDVETPFDPRSPYAVAKQMAFYSSLNARRSESLCTVNGILFNHESPRRGKTFVTKKITRHISSFVKNRDVEPLKLGNLDAIRDWGFAPDYVEIMYDSVINPLQSVYVCGTGVGTTVREFCSKAFDYIGCDIEFDGAGLDEIGYLKSSGKKVIEISQKYFRPLEVDRLIAGERGNLLLGRKSSNIDEIIGNMIEYDLQYQNYGGREHENRHSKFWK